MLTHIVNREWLSLSQAAEYLQVSESFLRKQVRLKSIPFSRLGSKALRFRRARLDFWAEGSNAADFRGNDTKN